MRKTKLAALLAVALLSFAGPSLPAAAGSLVSMMSADAAGLPQPKFCGSRYPVPNSCVLPPNSLTIGSVEFGK